MRGRLLQVWLLLSASLFCGCAAAGDGTGQAVSGSVAQGSAGVAEAGANGTEPGSVPGGVAQRSGRRVGGLFVLPVPPAELPDWESAHELLTRGESFGEAHAAVLLLRYYLLDREGYESARRGEQVTLRGSRLSRLALFAGASALETCVREPDAELTGKQLRNVWPRILLTVRLAETLRLEWAQRCRTQILEHELPSLEADRQALVRQMNADPRRRFDRLVLEIEQQMLHEKQKLEPLAELIRAGRARLDTLSLFSEELDALIAAQREPRPRTLQWLRQQLLEGLAQ